MHRNDNSLNSSSKQLNFNLTDIGKKTKKAVDIIFVIAVFLFIASYACKLTMSYFPIIDTLYVSGTIGLSIIALYRVFFAYFEDKKKVVLPLLAIVFGAVFNYVTGNNIVLLAATAAIAGMGVSADKILISGICGNLVMICNNIYVTLMSGYGLFVADNQERQYIFLGDNTFSVSKMNNFSSTDFGAHYFWIIAPYLWVRGKKITWGEIFGLAGLNIFIYTLTAAKTALLCIFILIFCAFVMKIWPLISKNIKPKATEAKENIFVRIFNVCVKFSYVIFSAFCILFSALFTVSSPLFMTLNDLLHRRLSLAKRGMLEHGIHLFSSGIQNYGMDSSADGFYNFLDCSYINLLILYGVLVLLFYLLCMTSIQIKHKKYIYGAVILAVCAISCIEEHHLAELPYNMFMLIVFADFDIDKKLNPPVDKKIKNINLSNILNLSCFGFCAVFIAMSVMNYYSKYKVVKELDRLDSRAGEIFMAVQSNIDTLTADGSWETITSDMESCDYGQKITRFGDFADVTGVHWHEVNLDPKVHSFYAVSYDSLIPESSASIVDIMLSDNVKALIGSGSVIIEYDVITGKLYSVWYCESTGCYAFDEGRRADRAGRLKDDVSRVEGYYTGNIYG